MLYHVCIMSDLSKTETEPVVGADSLISGEAFGARPDISARSVLVTIFGDSVVPAGGEIWLADLIELCRQFGFNQRLVRTSMFRLAAEGWFETDRVGRRSRYRLTAWAIEEFARAEDRIYGRPPTEWDGHWTLVVLDTDLVPRAEAELLRRELAGHGFAAIAPGLLAHPRHPTQMVARVAARTGLSSPVPVATAEFPDLAQLADTGWIRALFELGPVAGRYQIVVDRYHRLGADHLTGIGDDDAFALRVMVVHDLRRARLIDPDLPLEVLGAHWPAATAYGVAASLYHQVAPGAERWFNDVTGLTVAPGRTARRFA
jgi:phenylacetic acid degradation operon negative regulatory protein